ncbi:MAG: winged helix-turn-helix domain-containing protein [Pyrobaculum sp.]
MARKRRSRLEIVVDILRTLREECKPPTRIATEANLAYDRMAKLLKTLVAGGLVRENLGTYCITQEGVKMLDAYEQWRRFLEALGL